MKSILAAAMLMLSMGASAQATYTATDGTQ